VGLFFQRTRERRRFGNVDVPSVVVVHAPSSLLLQDLNPWCKALVMTGGAFLLAGTLPKREQT
jgi:hypothetical protein